MTIKQTNRFLNLVLRPNKTSKGFNKRAKNSKKNPVMNFIEISKDINEKSKDFQIEIYALANLEFQLSQLQNRN